MNEQISELNKEQLASHYMNSAVRQLLKGRPSLALEILARALELEVAVRDLEFIRALCLCQMHHLYEAREALANELSHFPDHEAAKELLGRVVADCEMIAKQLDQAASAAEITEEGEQSSSESRSLREQVEKASIEAAVDGSSPGFPVLSSKAWIGEHINKLGS